MYDVTIFGLNFTLNPVAFTLPIGNGWDVYWYGIIIATGFLLAIIYGLKTAKRYDIDVDKMIDVILVTTPFAILCARAYYCIFDGEKLNSIGEFFGVGTGAGFSGLAIYGAVIGAAIGGIVMCRIKKLNLFDMYDLAAAAFLLAQGIGRWGNFINQEAYGTFTGSSWWGMTSDRTAREMGSAALVHPCFLYESIWCIAGFFVLNYIGKHRKFKGQVALTYGIWYGIERGLLELLRTDSLKAGQLRVSSVLSFALCITCAIIMYITLNKKKETVAENAYVSQFDEDNDEEIPEKQEIDSENTNEETDNGTDN